MRGDVNTRQWSYCLRWSMYWSSGVRTSIKLESNIVSNPDLRNFDLQDISIECYGISGGRVGRSDHVRDFECVIRINNPKGVVFHLCGNDLDDKKITPDEVDTVMLRYINLLKTFAKRYNLHVIVVELLFRETTRNVDSTTYNEYVTQANQRLKTECQNERDVTFWKVKGLKESKRNIFYDGVHLNRQVGQPKYYRNIRGAILHAYELCKNSLHVSVCLDCVKNRQIYIIIIEQQLSK